MRVLVWILLVLLCSCTEEQSTMSEPVSTKPIFRFANIELDIPENWQEQSSLYLTTFVSKENPNLRIYGHSLVSQKVEKVDLEETYLKKLKKRFTSIEKEEQIGICDGKVEIIQIEGTFLKRPYISSKSFNKLYNHCVLSAIVYTSEGSLNFWLDGPIEQIKQETLNFHIFLSSFREMKEESHNHIHNMEQDEIVLATRKSLSPGAEEGAFDFGEFTLKVPDSWIQVKPEKEMRLAEFQLKENNEYEVVAFNFGKMDLPVQEIVEKNVMRWRGQFKELKEERNVPLEHSNLALIYFRGLFMLRENMMDADGKEMPNYCVLNAVVPSSTGPYYFRLQAPKEIVDRELDNMKAFLNSYKKKDPSQQHAHAHQQHDHDSHSERSEPSHDQDSHSERAISNNGELTIDNLYFKIPETWEQMPPKSSMRKAQFRPKKHKQYEVPVFRFQDNFGSLEERIQSNVSRWEGQFEKVEEKKMIDLEIENAALLYLSGTYTVKASPFAQSGTPTSGYAALNAMIDTPQGQYFFRLVAPDEVVKEELPAFVAFLNSCQIK